MSEFLNSIAKIKFYNFVQNDSGTQMGFQPKVIADIS